jgi:hypothetical protein
LAAAGGAAAEDFTVDLAPGQSTAIGWFNVDGGQQVTWQVVDGTGYAALHVESRAYGEMAAGDGGIEAGCARAVEDDEVRIRVANTVLTNTHDAHYVIRVVVADDNGTCPTVADWARARQEYLDAQPRLPFDADTLFRIMGAVIAATVVIMVAISLLAQRRRAREEPPPREGQPSDPNRPRP